MLNVITPRGQIIWDDTADWRRVETRQNEERKRTNQHREWQLETVNDNKQSLKLGNWIAFVLPQYFWDCWGGMSYFLRPTEGLRRCSWILLSSYYSDEQDWWRHLGQSHRLQSYMLINPGTLIQFIYFISAVYISTLKHFFSSPELFPVSGLLQWSPDARLLLSRFRPCTTRLKFPSSCFRPEQSRWDHFEHQVIQIFPVAAWRRLTLHFSITQHSGVTSYPKYSIKWGPGTNMAGVNMKHIIQV